MKIKTNNKKFKNKRIDIGNTSIIYGKNYNITGLVVMAAVGSVTTVCIVDKAIKGFVNGIYDAITNKGGNYYEG